MIAHGQQLQILWLHLFSRVFCYVLHFEDINFFLNTTSFIFTVSQTI